MHEQDQNYKREKRERNAHFSRERKRLFLVCLELGKRGKSHPRLSNTREKLHLEALGLWWSGGTFFCKLYLVRFLKHFPSMQSYTQQEIYSGTT